MREVNQIIQVEADAGGVLLAGWLFHVQITSFRPVKIDNLAFLQLCI